MHIASDLLQLRDQLRSEQSSLRLATVQNAEERDRAESLREEVRALESRRERTERLLGDLAHRSDGLELRMQQMRDAETRLRTQVTILKLLLISLQL